MENNNYEQMTVSSLKNLAREREVYVDTISLKKSELIKQLRNPPPLEYTRAQCYEPGVTRK